DLPAAGDPGRGPLREPARVVGAFDRVYPGARVQLGHDGGEVVADGPDGQVHDGRDLGGVGACRGEPEYLVLTGGQRVGPVVPGRHGELRVDDLAAGRDVADGAGQF